MSLYSFIGSNTDLVEFISHFNYCDLRSYGNNFRSNCPICGGHNETEFVVNKNVFFCHRCHAGGNIINFVQHINRCSYDSAIRIIADYYNFSIDSDKEYLADKLIIDRNSELIRSAKVDIDCLEDYLVNKRKLSMDTASEFDLGYVNSSSGQYCLIPLKDSYGRCIAFAKRWFDRQPKYTNSKNNALYEKSSYLFNSDKALKLIKDRLYLCEGYFDAISGHEQGVPICSYNFSELNNGQIKFLLNSYINPETKIILCPDNDSAGLSHVKNTRNKFLSIAPRFQVRVIRMPKDKFNFPITGSNETVERECKDISDLHVQGIRLDSLPTVHIDQFVLEQLLSEAGDLQSQYNVVGDYIKTVSNPMIRSDLAKFLSDYWKQDVSEIKKWFNVEKEVKDEVVFKSSSGSLREYETESRLGSYTFGFPTVDGSLGGVRKRDVVLVGAYPSVGKTFFAGQYALHCILNLGLNVLFFSLEMPASALIERLCSSVLGISTDDLMSRARSGELFDEYNVLKEKLDKNLRIVDDSSLGFDDLDTVIKKANITEFNNPVDVVIVDYIQILSNVKSFEDIEYTAKRFKWLAKENNIIFFCLSQLARGTDSWVKPVMSKLKGGGSIEASGDIILMLYRKGDSPMLSIQEREKYRNIVTCSIEKGRRGYNVKEVDLLFNRETTSIAEFT